MAEDTLFYQIMTQQIVVSVFRGELANKLICKVLLFLTFFLVFLFLTLGFIRLVRYMDDRRTERGTGKKVDQMVSEEMRWQEGRLVMERKIIRGGGLGQGLGVGQGKGGMGHVGYSKLRREL